MLILKVVEHHLNQLVYLNIFLYNILLCIKEVRGFYDEQYAQESRFHTLKAQMLINAVQLKRANDEKSSYLSKDKATKSYRYNKN